MKIIFRMFFKTLRIVLGPIMLAWESLTRPKGIARPPAQQAQVDRACGDLTLYQFKTCPFCIKVRQEIHRLSLDIKRLDAQRDEKNRDELLAGGGAVKVPCLRISSDSGPDQWLYESSAIIQYLQQRFAEA